ncbi:MAG TPA: hypothetical protein VFC78_17480 [Tepidisphaeraceae bacterium]|nr:hypothetical protein [Tepidisphaeraceae bacterium]
MSRLTQTSGTGDGNGENAAPQQAPATGAPGPAPQPLALPAPPDARHADSAGEPRGRDQSHDEPPPKPPLYKRPWFWIVIGVVPIRGNPHSRARGRQKCLPHDFE